MKYIKGIILTILPRRKDFLYILAFIKIISNKSLQD